MTSQIPLLSRSYLIVEDFSLFKIVQYGLANTLPAHHLPRHCYKEVNADQSCSPNRQTLYQLTTPIVTDRKKSMLIKAVLQTGIRSTRHTLYQLTTPIDTDGKKSMLIKAVVQTGKRSTASPPPSTLTERSQCCLKLLSKQQTRKHSTSSPPPPTLTERSQCC
ncbi:hypothetical protein RRG08_013498 [Elysia crispata]|uniref:Uncharacterized protein n=1 Tax=Elysia crispata TaxID=231223 RepID=A0AAE0Y0M9_9GAST|nr:hypothetical protein RRG08_013498 [Elysia crispata]